MKLLTRASSLREGEHVIEPVHEGTSRRTETRWFFKWGGSMAAFVAAAFLVIVWNPAGNEALLWLRVSFWGDRAFSSEEWMRFKGDDSSLSIEDQDRRGEMLAGLLGTHDIVGSTEDEIEVLLGPPDERHDDEIWYFVGNHVYEIDPDVFVIRLAQGVATHVSVRSL